MGAGDDVAGGEVDVLGQDEQGEESGPLAYLLSPQ